MADECSPVTPKLSKKDIEEWTQLGIKPGILNMLISGELEGGELDLDDFDPPLVITPEQRAWAETELANDREYQQELNDYFANLGKAIAEHHALLEPHQHYPVDGPLAKQSDLHLSALRSRVGASRFANETVYCYVVSSVRRVVNWFEQRGSAPNFQGGSITLCTCKHRMRTFLDRDEWKGTWIAGFTGKHVGDGRNALFYLMRVRCALPSHAALWNSSKISTATKITKRADKNPVGDLYRPKRSATSKPWDPASYFEPTANHVHRKRGLWEKDICYKKGCSNRQPALLVGETGRSFLWSRPLVFHKASIHRGQKRYTMRDLFKNLSAR